MQRKVADVNLKDYFKKCLCVSVWWWYFGQTNVVLVSCTKQGGGVGDQYPFKHFAGAQYAAAKCNQGFGPSVSWH